MGNLWELLQTIPWAEGQGELNRTFYDRITNYSPALTFSRRFWRVAFLTKTV